MRRKPNALRQNTRRGMDRKLQARTILSNAIRSGRDTNIIPGEHNPDCLLCARLAGGFTTTRNGVEITPLCEHCSTHHLTDASCWATFRCAECRRLLPHSEEEWATLGIVRLAHGRRTKAHPSGVCRSCFATSSRNTARDWEPGGVSEGQPADPFEGLGR